MRTKIHTKLYEQKFIAVLSFTCECLLFLLEDFVYYVYEDEEALKKVDQSNLLKLLEYMTIKPKQYLALKQQENTLDD